MKKEIVDDDFEEVEEDCECEDMPITYCKKCKRFFVLDREANREEVLIQTGE